jgi:carotenoid 1,2-hydratase
MDGFVSQTGIGDENSGPVSSGRQHASGGGRADGGAVRPAGSAAPHRGPRFDAAVPPGGYLWWYLDGISDDKRYAITLIAFVGSVFSPYYAWSGRRDPLNHCAINVALYGKPGARWTMTERGRNAVQRDADTFRVGPSSLRWVDGALEITLDEISAPLPKRVRGTIRVTPTAFPSRAFTLDGDGKHVWQPIAPKTQIEVSLNKPNLNWRGTAYLDSNFGSEPLEDAFKEWTWSRAHLSRDSVVLYDAERRDGTHATLALRFDPEGYVQQVASPPLTPLASTKLWHIPRSTRADADQSISLRQTLEDTPFYARTILDTQLYGEPAQAFHESLLLDRLRMPIVRAMLPFRMPRRIF